MQIWLHSLKDEDKDNFITKCIFTTAQGMQFECKSYDINGCTSVAKMQSAPKNINRIYLFDCCCLACGFVERLVLFCFILVRFVVVCQFVSLLLLFYTLFYEAVLALTKMYFFFMLYYLCQCELSALKYSPAFNFRSDYSQFSYKLTS